MREKLLDAAQREVQMAGYQGFSFHTLARDAGITTATIHYYFPTKEALGVTLVRRYRERLAAAMADIAAQPGNLADHLQNVVSLHAQPLDDGGRICIMTALAGEFKGLPKEIQSEVRGLVEEAVRSLRRIFEAARARGETLASDAESLARVWVCALQGSLTFARATRPQLLEEVASELIRASHAQPRA
jgi:TetR/AcrR family transcriptional repressor of nem operon